MEATIERKNKVLKAATGLSSATLIGLVSYFYSFFAEKIPNIEQKIAVIERDISTNGNVSVITNKELTEKIEYLREDIKNMRHTQEKIYEILIRISRDRRNERD